MKGIQRKAMHAAVLASLGVAGTGHAVHVNPKHLGSVLIYPYYTVRADSGGPSTRYFDNYLSVVNTTASTKAVKVRFLEGKRAAEVLSFNLFLSPFDVWTGGVIRTTTAGEGEEGAKLISTDRSCVTPLTLFSTATTNSLNRFRNTGYAGSNDGGGATLDRTREGYLEVLEMGDITNTVAIAAARHVNGVPGNCAYFEALDANLGTQMTPPTGGLYGGLSLINVLVGADYSYDAVALDQWSPAAVQFSPAGSPLPSIGPEGASRVSNVLMADGAVTSTWTTSRDAVSAALMQESVYNEWVIETATASGTDWVVTFPTKKLYVGLGGGTAAPPFNANFNNGLSCDAYNGSYYNREELSPPPAMVFLPLPPVVLPPTGFCYAANVLTFSNSNMLGSTNSYNLDFTSVGRTGHLIVNFDMGRQFLGPAPTTINGVAAGSQRYFGLPVVGFMIQDFFNGNVGTPPVLSDYGGNFDHKYYTRIAP
jgi:hypothetical protein